MGKFYQIMSKNKDVKYLTTGIILTVGAVSNTIRVNILYSCDSRNCITWQEGINC